MRSAPAIVGAVLAAAVRAPAAAYSTPSPHGQPWLFEVAGEHIRLLLNRAVLTPGDEDEAARARVACGAALCNLRIALRAQDRVGFVDLLPDERNPDLLAVVRLAGERVASTTEHRLAQAVERLHLEGHELMERAVPSATRAALSSAAHTEGARLLFVDTAERYDRVSALLTGPPEVPARLVERQPALALVLTPATGDRYDLLAGAGMQRALLTASVLGLSATLVPQPFAEQTTRDELRSAFTTHGHARALLWFGFAKPVIAEQRRPADEVSSPIV